MPSCLRRYIVIFVIFIILGFVFQEEKENVEHSISKQKKIIVQQMVQQQLSSEINNHLESFKEMQKTSPLLQHTKYKLLAGSSPHGKRLLTVGISSMQHPHGSHLLDTLHSLFRATSEAELECIVVLVHLSDADPEWLLKTADSILKLFALHIRSRRLLVVSGLLGDSSLSRPVKLNYSSPCAELYSRQREGHALLMNFASQLSEYFLLLEDNTQFAPNFVSAIYWTLLAWKEERWVVLEFSSLDSGKVLHTSDLSRFTSFFLLFPEDAPTHLLLSKFHHFLGQTVPIRFSISLFHHMGNKSQLDDTCFPLEQDKVFGEADNPVATVHTSMHSLWNVIPQYAYILNEEYYSTLDPVEGNHFTVVLNKPQRVTRIAVLTGSADQGLYQLNKGHVLLGSEPLGDSRGCARYTLLGPLVDGKLDQRVFYEEGSGRELNCIQLLVLESQESWLLIKQIKVWVEPEEDEI
ncbi:alpha-1,6-mannosyl-glycoprotein 4-beta-N-acetylglucosaminyltransferase-like [Ochotona princeps]|uniref:alpha-1,6-mannosyl-glycoprotein 4-beta-N-acetylglucosaminyltransferase-like n=1 Tax=Ochotona princeps TaxID=9978 RepID=UPI0027147BF1|nr:alpha-1,6-mannosyl-glycoprotein 4-beta-N-acetylglucosaminyltransferase-like [Ochotona princeps]XP_058525006.1 alpha-1,6-mannosyl-glycoprotein 4-beta-N-acetylglucosaminyltransferase-like [Ochotona princeps]